MTNPKNPFRELDRLFERMQENVEEASRWWESEPLVGTEQDSGPVKIDLEDTGDELVLTAELPGFETEDIDVQLTERMLQIAAEHEEEFEEEGDSEYIHRERHRASISRSIPLPEPVDAEAVSASFTNGVLTVQMPKSEPEASGTEIEVD